MAAAAPVSHVSPFTTAVVPALPEPMRVPKIFETIVSYCLFPKGPSRACDVSVDYEGEQTAVIWVNGSDRYEGRIPFSRVHDVVTIYGRFIFCGERKSPAGVELEVVAYDNTLTNPLQLHKEQGSFTSSLATNAEHVVLHRHSEQSYAVYTWDVEMCGKTVSFSDKQSMVIPSTDPRSGICDVVIRNLHNF